MNVTTLYRLLDEGGHLLYVGIAGNPGRRADQHAHTKSWWPNVALIALEHFPTREEAESAEQRAIAVERPKYNVTYATGSPSRAAKVDRQSIDRILSALRIRRHVPKVKITPRAARCTECGTPVKKRLPGGRCDDCWEDHRQARLEAHPPKRPFEVKVRFPK